jgi:hypothetical protein
MVFQLIDMSKVTDVAKAGDKVWGSPPAGLKVLAGYTCQGLAYPGMPSNSIVSIRIVDAENNAALSSCIYPVLAAGATVWTTPVMDLPAGTAADLDKKFRG